MIKVKRIINALITVFGMLMGIIGTFIILAFSNEITLKVYRYFRIIEPSCYQVINEVCGISEAYYYIGLFVPGMLGLIILGPLTMIFVKIMEPKEEE